ncbi:MAG: Spy/CpxP family protein refolding chaperone [Spirochaetales bacterium]|nr:Spy/CpxP family protein refolding chaperone [Leptospiraceae bacterium]MCP5482196.1 Spy/CpxP family protein refolding chaperone [Spirochaetales bacterium]MCP5484692.1 Spy/CpxP family protein refolding chaperone [Spirochaetales bacterium]
MKNVLLVSALSVSLAFNAFFALGYWQSRQRATELAQSGAEMERLREELALTPEQTLHLRGLRTALDADLEEARQRYEARRVAFMAGVASGHSEPHVMHAFIEETEADLDKLQMSAHERFHTFSQDLKPEQREALARMIAGDRAWVLP